MYSASTARKIRVAKTTSNCAPDARVQERRAAYARSMAIISIDVNLVTSSPASCYWLWPLTKAGLWRVRKRHLLMMSPSCATVEIGADAFHVT